MELLKPNLISGEILTLIEDAKEKIVLVSPYVKISKWFRLVNKIKNALERGVDIEIYVRAGEKDSIREVEALGLKPIEVKNLHCKFYYNEKYGVVTSLNLLLSSEINSLEMAYKTVKKWEYKELCTYRDNYVCCFDKEQEIEKEVVVSIDDNQSIDKGERVQILGNDWKYVVCSKIKFFIYRNASISKGENGSLFISAGNRYELSILKNENYSLCISGIISGKEYDKAINKEREFEKETGMSVSVFEGGNGKYASIDGELKRHISTNNLDGMETKEFMYIVDCIVKFVKSVDDFKRMN